MNPTAVFQRTDVLRHDLHTGTTPCSVCITALDGTYDRAVIDNCGYRCLIETHPCEAAFNRAVVDEAAHFPLSGEKAEAIALRDLE